MAPVYTIQQAQDLTLQAAKHISDTQPELWRLPELSICHHLASALEEKFDGHNIDVELIKDDRRRPDIVIHQRGHNKNNLVIFQVKKNPTLAQIKEDLFKISDTFFRKPYLYQYGIFLSVGPLPKDLPEFDNSRIRFVEVDGWAEITEEEFAQKHGKQSCNL